MVCIPCSAVFCLKKKYNKDKKWGKSRTEGKVRFSAWGFAANTDNAFWKYSPHMWANLQLQILRESYSYSTYPQAKFSALFLCGYIYFYSLYLLLPRVSTVILVLASCLPTFMLAQHGELKNMFYNWKLVLFAHLCKINES